MDRECSCSRRASEQARTGRWMLTRHSDTDTSADYYTADNQLMSSRRYEAAHISTRQQTRAARKEARMTCRGRLYEAD